MKSVNYIAGFVAAVPTANRETYRHHARDRRDGVQGKRCALGLRVLGRRRARRQMTSFPMAVKRQPDETVVFAWIAWPSKAVRDAGMARVMADPRMDTKSNPMPFDDRRLIYGGFEVLLQQ